MSHIDKQDINYISLTQAASTYAIQIELCD